MANINVIINGVQYNDCGEVNIPKVGGGTARFMETSEATVSSAHILSGKVAYNATGSVTGSMANNGSTSGTISTKNGTVTIPAGYTTGGSVSILASSVSDLTASSLLQGKTVLGVTGTLSVPTISQDATTKVLSIS